MSEAVILYVHDDEGNTVPLTRSDLAASSGSQAPLSVPLDLHDDRRNVCLGEDVFASNTYGGGNVAIGYQCLRNATEANYNVAIGDSVMPDGNTAYHNIGIGQGALQRLTTGVYNICVGPGAGQFLTTGQYNVVIGPVSLAEDATQEVIISDGAGQVRFHSNRHKCTAISIPEYANDAAADADPNLMSGGLYRLPGSRAVYQKPAS